MHFVIKQSAFLKELHYTQGVVERRNTVPILSHVLLEAAGKNLLLTTNRPRCEYSVYKCCGYPGRWCGSGVGSKTFRDH